MSGFRDREQAARVEHGSDAAATRLASIYAGEIAGLYAMAAKRMAAHSVPVAAAADPARWGIPDADELLPLDLARVLEARRNHRARFKIANDFLVDAVPDVAFDVRNVVAEGVARRAGHRITTVLGTIRQDVMHVVQNSWEQGLSIPDAAEGIRSQAEALTDHMARRIARTELAGLVNGASVASAQLAGMPAKEWLTAQDSRVRPDHQEAEGQVVPVEQPFIVGGATLMFPGDQTSAPAEEVIHCRCTVTYPEDGITAGGAMTKPKLAMRARRNGKPKDPRSASVQAAIVAAAEPGARWRAYLCPEGVWTSDGRMFEEGSLTWRDLPLTLMSQVETDVGHDGARVAGRIDSITRESVEGVTWLVGEGAFDTGVDGSEAARMVADQTLRGLSVDIADMVAEWEWVDENGDVIPQDADGMPTAEPAGERMRATSATIMGATVTPFPAFADARIELAEGVDGAPPEAATVRQALSLRPVTAAAVTDFSGAMVALYPTKTEAAALAVGGQPAEELHVTLAHVPGSETMPTVDAIAAAVADLADSSGPLVGEVTGVGRFAVGEDGTPIVALVDALGMNAFRAAVAGALGDAGIEFSTNHDFVPHITIDYAEDGAEIPDVPLGQALSFLTLSVVGPDGTRVDYPLQAAASGSGGPPPPKPPAQAAEAAQEAASRASMAEARVPTDEALATTLRAVEAGFLTVDEARSVLFGLPPVAGGALPGHVEPETALVAAAIEAIVRVAAAPVNVAAPDLNPIGAALEAMTAAIAAGNERIAALVGQTVTASGEPRDPVNVYVGGPEGRKRVVFERDAAGRASAAEITTEETP